MKKRLNTIFILCGVMLFFSTSIMQAQSSTVRAEGGLEVITKNVGAATLLRVRDATNVKGFDFQLNAQENLAINESGVGARIFIKKGGNVGINNNNPQATLDVIGDVKMLGRLTLDSGSSCIFIGQDAGISNTSFIGENTFIGFRAGEDNTTGFGNTFLGRWAGLSNINGTNNTAIGKSAGQDLDLGGGNTFLGSQAADDIESGSENVAVGHLAQVFGNNNTVLGFRAEAGEVVFDTITFEDIFMNVNNATAIGNKAEVLVDNKMRFGNGSVTVIEGQVDWSFPSDGRFKNNIEENIKGLDFILNLRPVTYHFDVNKYNEHLGVTATKEEEELESIESASKILYSGFIAQEVEKAAEDLDYDFSGLVKPQSDKDNYGLRYGSFVVPLVKAVQEQQVQIEEKEEKIEALVKENEEIKARLAKIEAMLSGKAQGSTITSKLTDATLQQNAPNPFTEATNISYFIPENIKSASLQVMDQNGRIIKTIPIQATGNGQITLQANLLSAGTYSYSLILDGQVMETKQMVLTH